MKLNKKVMMKKNYFIMLGSALVLLASCNAPKRYGCNKRRCIVMQTTAADAAQKSAMTVNKKNA
ncbi:hypothetical protein KJK34_13155 [Flavobacterium sp. D11R37]|uniref:hypothetical protein n=1 Tax=Flavobacterium coralii TaxID=2838017 RepID=UPI001CA65FDE|nr:hypothetical protein [Flavobacterium coralii]MBY8963704.1 hypothetical protein [Flavobacterium coralii]